VLLQSCAAREAYTRMVDLHQLGPRAAALSRGGRLVFTRCGTFGRRPKGPAAPTSRTSGADLAAKSLLASPASEGGELVRIPREQSDEWDQ